MPRKLFYELDKQKQLTITQAALSEFAEKSYHESSTNSIVKKAGIGKGSLFKYFSNKEDLYFYIVDYIIDDLTAESKEDVASLPENLFERVTKYSEIEFAWYIKNPIKYTLIKKAFVDDHSDIYKKTEKRYALFGDRFYYSLFEDIDTDQLKWDKKKTLDVLKWFLKGFNEEFIREIAVEDNIDRIQEMYLIQLQDYMTLLKEGLCK